MNCRETFIRILGSKQTKQAREMSNVFIETVNGSCTIIDEELTGYTRNAEEVNDQLADALLNNEINNIYAENLNNSCVFINGQSIELHQYFDLQDEIVREQDHQTRNRDNIFINNINGACDFFIENNNMVYGDSQEITAQQYEKKINNLFIKSINGNISFHHFFSSNNAFPSNVFINKLNGNCHFLNENGTDNCDARNMSEQTGEVGEKQVKQRNNFYINKINGLFNGSIESTSTRLHENRKFRRTYPEHDKIEYNVINGSKKTRVQIIGLSSCKNMRVIINGKRFTNMNGNYECKNIGGANSTIQVLENKTFTSSRGNDRDENRKQARKNRSGNSSEKSGNTSTDSDRSRSSRSQSRSPSDQSGDMNVNFDESGCQSSHSDISIRSKSRNPSEESQNAASDDSLLAEDCNEQLGNGKRCHN